MTWPRAEPESDSPAGTGVRWLSGPSLRLHAALLAGLALCAVATWFEWRRARAGHEVAWVYTFEWPLFALLGTALWWRLLHADPAGGAGSPEPDGPATAPGDDGADEGLLAWQAYLARLHESDPPGTPPVRRG